ncbi:MAG: NADH-ubiquinone oxidoreductase-F iron-sulfur binding region domain-containing protein [Porticoccaceae bacterium]|nr:NADH-ubiquinone oxidoreductase-F iron-sulfur binding region domain-containing protein [Porticoccaceae bacterium]MDG1474506.1 NADH-ubiquinone oxidoreductase-F iron-sulfur binding region domain-containing protein [Porticoccaceae bacterium]
MRVQLFVPQDTTALALGADAVAMAIAKGITSRGLDIDVVRNGSRGMFWLEPLVELKTAAGRVAFGSVNVTDVESVLDAVERCVAGEEANCPLFLGASESIDYLAKQQRLTFKRSGIGDPLCLKNYQKLHGFKGLEKALTMSGQQIVDEVKTSGLRGRGGAAFPAGIKWQTVLNAPAEQKYIVCNADEGDSGTFADRLLMESDPYQLIEGMVIAGLAVGANQGYIYLRSEYPVAHNIMNQAIDNATKAGFLGKNIGDSGSDFFLEVRLGAGAYICGEETSLLESLEGKRGMVRAKPPLPAIEGLFGMPTVVNNVLTLGAVASILGEGATKYKDFGMGRSRGTLAVQLAGNIKRGGLIELAFGVTLRQIVDDFGAGTFSGRPIKAIQMGGPLGAFLPESQWDTPLDYEAFAAIKAMIGHGGIVVFDDTADMAAQARFAMEFCVVESCGKCTPCRIGSTRGVEVIDRIVSNQERDNNLILLHELCDTMELGSLCAMGGMTPFPVRSALTYFEEDFGLSSRGDH